MKSRLIRQNYWMSKIEKYRLVFSTYKYNLIKEQLCRYRLDTFRLFRSNQIQEKLCVHL